MNAAAKPLGHKLRIGRCSEAGGIYLITTVTNRRRPLFEDYSTGRILVDVLRKARQSADTLAFVVMPDHLHWLMQLQEGYTLSQAVGFVKSASSRAVNLRYAHCGALWKPGFHDRALRKEESALNCARYIIANPVRAGLVERAEDYPLWDACWL